MKEYTTTHEAYLGTLRDIWENPSYRVAPRGIPIKEKLDYQFKILNPSSEPIQTLDLERNKVIAEYTAKELALYNSGSNRVEDFAKASKFWEKIANVDGTINSSYGFLLWKNYSCTSKFSNRAMTMWEWAKESLKRDKDTRQAVMHFNLPEHCYQGNKDFTCTMYGNWLIREDKLNFTIAMRSQDMVKGAGYDLPFFCSLMDRMLEELKDKYPNLQKGTYTHICNSIHCYEKDEKTILGMLGM